ncbi:MAG: DUF4234 domain-containing protein [Clostridia bacterium]|nr:DUF4234 domain-containing protein [Clostridia bacterium]
MRKIKDDRSLIPYLLLGLITFGIYNIWYLHHMVKDVNELCREDGKQSSGVLAYILLSLVTCGFYSFFWWFRIGDMLDRAVHRRGLNTSISGGYVLISMVLGVLVCGIASWVGIHKVFEATNDLATDYNANIRTRAYQNPDNAGA